MTMQSITYHLSDDGMVFMPSRPPPASASNIVKTHEACTKHEKEI